MEIVTAKCCEVCNTYFATENDINVVCSDCYNEISH